MTKFFISILSIRQMIQLHMFAVDNGKPLCKANTACVILRSTTMLQHNNNHNNNNN